MTLKKGAVHVLGITLSRAPHAPSFELQNIEVPSVSLFVGFCDAYNTDPTFQDIYTSLLGKRLDSVIRKLRVGVLRNEFRLGKERLFYGKKLRMS